MAASLTEYIGITSEAIIYRYRNNIKGALDKGRPGVYESGVGPQHGERGGAMSLLLSLIVFAGLLAATGCGQLAPTRTFEQQRAAIVTYLRAYNTAQGDLAATISTIEHPSSAWFDSAVRDADRIDWFRGKRHKGFWFWQPLAAGQASANLTAPELIEATNFIERRATAWQGALHRLNDLTPPAIDEARTHLSTSKSLLQDQITALQDLQAGVNARNQDEARIARLALYDKFGTSEERASEEIELAAESLMLKYNIAVAEVRYPSRDK